jgi:hypothetical protein
MNGEIPRVFHSFSRETRGFESLLSHQKKARCVVSAGARGERPYAAIRNRRARSWKYSSGACSNRTEKPLGTNRVSL